LNVQEYPAIYSFNPEGDLMFNHAAIGRSFTFVFAITVIAGGGFAAQAPTSPVAQVSGVTTNLKGGPDAVRIDISTWSTDAARMQFVDAWNLVAPASASGARGAGPAAGARGARGARGGGAPVPEASAPETVSAPAAAAAPPGGARGARGGARGGPPAGNPADAASSARNTPQGALAAALQSTEGVGYFWTSESVGYSLRYAYRVTQADGSERIILATDRRLGGWNDTWKSTAGTPNDYEFSVIELRLNAKGEGEGKISNVGKVAVDTAANTIALEDYAAQPVVIKSVKIQTKR
jgi:hypothetical protein